MRGYSILRFMHLVCAINGAFLASFAVLTFLVQAWISEFKQEAAITNINKEMAIRNGYSGLCSFCIQFELPMQVVALLYN